MIKLEYKGKTYELDAKWAVYDGCHKIYLVRSDNEAREAMGYGYELCRVSDIPEIWDASCPLRFISFWDVENIKGDIIPQCVDDGDVEITRDGDTVIIRLASTIEIDAHIDSFIDNGACWYV